ncbi:hypothetical protein PJL18_04330 [Paenarthrobacter nicotinovorans]|nr:hypothetical protein [Paenarthrobacter nicotinovorans]
MCIRARGCVAPGGQGGMDLGDFLIEVRDGDCGYTAQGHAFQHPQTQQHGHIRGQRNKQSQDRSGSDADGHGTDPADPVGNKRPRKHGGGETNRGQRNAECGFCCSDPEVRCHEGQHGLGGIQLCERRDAGQGQCRQNTAVAAGPLGVPVPAFGFSLNARSVHRPRVGRPRLPIPMHGLRIIDADVHESCC